MQQFVHVLDDDTNDARQFEAVLISHKLTVRLLFALVLLLLQALRAATTNAHTKLPTSAPCS